MLARHVLGKLGWRALLLIWSVLLPIAGLAAWLLSWTIELDCEPQESGNIRCVAVSAGILHENERSFSARDVLETPTGDLVLPMPNASLIDADDWRAVTAKLHDLAKETSSGSLSATLRAAVIWRIAAGCLLLFVPLTLWACGRYTVVSVDRGAGTVTTQRRLYGLTLTEAAFQLDDVTDLVARARGSAKRILLRTRHGDVLLVQVPSRRADEHVSGLKRVLFE